MIIPNLSMAPMREGDPERRNDGPEATMAAFHAHGRGHQNWAARPQRTLQQRMFVGLITSHPPVRQKPPASASDRSPSRPLGAASTLFPVRGQSRRWRTPPWHGVLHHGRALLFLVRDSHSQVAGGAWGLEARGTASGDVILISLKVW